MHLSKVKGSIDITALRLAEQPIADQWPCSRVGENPGGLGSVGRAWAQLISPKGRKTTILGQSSRVVGASYTVGNEY